MKTNKMNIIKRLSLLIGIVCFFSFYLFQSHSLENASAQYIDPLIESGTANLNDTPETFLAPAIPSPPAPTPTATPTPSASPSATPCQCTDPVDGSKHDPNTCWCDNDKLCSFDSYLCCTKSCGINIRTCRNNEKCEVDSNQQASCVPDPPIGDCNSHEFCNNYCTQCQKPSVCGLCQNVGGTTCKGEYTEVSYGCCCYKKSTCYCDTSIDCDSECKAKGFDQGFCENCVSGDLLPDDCCCYKDLPPPPCTLTYQQCVSQNCNGIDYENCRCTQCQIPGGGCKDDSDCPSCCSCDSTKHCSTKGGCADCWSCDTNHIQCPATQEQCCSKPKGCCQLDPTKCADDPTCPKVCCTATTACNSDGAEGQKICSSGAYFCECLKHSDGTCEWWHQQCLDTTRTCQDQGIDRCPPGSRR